MSNGWRRESGRGALRGLERLLPPLLFFAVALGFQIWQPVPWDADTAYHFAVGSLIREHGYLKTFPWTPFSILCETYADKEVFFHLLFAGVSGLDWIAASRLVGALGGVAILTALWVGFRAERVRLPWLWALLPLALSGSFAYRFALTRPHLFSIALALGLAFFAWRRSLFAVFYLALLYPLAYVGFPIALLLVGLVEGGRLASGERFEWKPLAAALTGMASGLVIHPNFPNIVKIAWVQNVTILLDTAWGQRTGFSIGSEFAPIDFLSFVYGGSLTALALAIAAIFLALRNRSEEGATLAFSFIALFFIALTLKTSRFVEYSVPFGFAAFALGSRKIGYRYLPHLFSGAALLYLAVGGYQPVEQLRYRTLDTPPEMVSAVCGLVPEGARVFTAGALITGEMMLALPNRTFMVALDPVYFHAKDAELYRVWFDLVHNPPPDPVKRIKEHFGSEWILCERTVEEYFPFLDAVSRDPSASLVYQDNLWVLYKLH